MSKDTRRCLKPEMLLVKSCGIVEWREKGQNVELKHWLDSSQYLQKIESILGKTFQF